MIIELFLIGLITGFIFYELTGISPGGVVAPAYIAMFIYQPGKIAVTIALALIIYAIIRLLTSRYILFGRRKLLLAVVLGFLLKLAIDFFIQPIPALRLDLQSIGYIIPGLIANEMTRQKVVPTFLALGIVSIMIFLISLLL
ncbi:MAG: poly-gamma-glutamate biosynthesis protein PgsC [Bacteroidales bacterium]|nr:poly-gamma-glutamate biosynthesis protein PgsC [Bacteroidales bacterium]